MAGINLLPWRENLRKQRLKQFGQQLVGALIIAVLGGVYWHLHMEARIDHQEERNQFVKNEIAKVDKIIAEIKELEKLRAQLISRMGVIQDLQVSRPQAVHLFDELVETIPDGAFLIGMQQNGPKVTLNGNSQSNARVSSFMRNIDGSEWVGNAQLQVIQQEERSILVPGMSHFRMVAQQRSPISKDEFNIVSPQEPAKKANKRGKNKKAKK